MKHCTIPVVLMILTVAGLLTTVSCAQKKTVTTPATQAEQEPEAVPETPKAEPVESGTVQAAQEIYDAAAALEEERAMALTAEKKEGFLTRHIHFAFDSVELDEEARTLAQEKAAWLAENPDVRVRIEGHCDPAGTEAYNMNLGKRRAITVKAYLKSLGIEEDRMTDESLGETRPISTASGKAADRLNRRVQFNIQAAAI